uniref:Uncharacterized protein n=1 Tax=Timema monikensis TaxID=170555 RepID=A0A7R9EEC7_9NEOP|nr:unnamed protein product [Timema monikensis]
MKMGCLGERRTAGAVLVFYGIFFGLFGLPCVVDCDIVENVVLKDDSAAYKRWQKTPNPLTMKFYLFNVTNPEEVRQGGQPILKEVGPYVYDVYRERVNLEKHEDGTISFQKKLTLFFNQEKSGDARQDDVVTIINVVLLSLTGWTTIGDCAFHLFRMATGSINFRSQKVSLRVSIARGKVDLPLLVRTSEDAHELAHALLRLLSHGATCCVQIVEMMGEVVSEIFVSPDNIFLKGTVGELLFKGIPVIDCTGSLSPNSEFMCGNLEGAMSETMIMKEGIFTFSFQRHRNGTGTETFRIDRGLSDPQNLGRIVEYEGREDLDVWSQDTCNMINGTDASIFPPSLTDSNIYIFSTFCCRSMSFEFEKEVVYKDVKAKKFINSPRNLEDPKVEESNECFCAGRGEERQCHKRGVIDVYDCTGNCMPNGEKLYHLSRNCMSNGEKLYHLSGNCMSNGEKLYHLSGNCMSNGEKLYHLPGNCMSNGEKLYHLSGNCMSNGEKLYLDSLSFGQLLSNLLISIYKSGVILHGVRRLQFNILLTKIQEVAMLRNVREGIFPFLWVEEEVDDYDWYKEALEKD